MAHGPRYRVPFRRRREGKTNYRNRFTLVRSRWDRLVVRKTLKHMVVQVIRAHPDGDITVAAAHSSELEKYGWDAATSNIPAAYLTGYLCAVRAHDKGIEKAILDIGVHRVVPGSRIFAALQGAVEAGMDIPHSADILPSDKRKKGGHIGTEKLFDTVVKTIEEGAP